MGGGRIPGPVGVHPSPQSHSGRAPAGLLSVSQSVVILPGGFVSTTPLVTPEDIEALARWVRDTGRELDHEMRVAFEEATIRIGKLPAGFPRELLHRYIFGNYATLTLSPAEFVVKVDPIASVIDPNRAVGGTAYTDNLQSDLLSKVQVSPAGVPIPTKFWGKYEVGAFHGAHNTGGLGRFRLIIDANVDARSEIDWSLEGTAIMRPEKWDFNWEWADLFAELSDGGLSFDMKQDLRGRERRTALGSSIPGNPFYVAMAGPMRVTQTSADEWATFDA